MDNYFEEPIMTCDVKVIAETIVHKVDSKVTPFGQNKKLSQIY